MAGLFFSPAPICSVSSNRYMQPADGLRNSNFVERDVRWNVSGKSDF
jgi:hypothetical protein